MRRSHAGTFAAVVTAGAVTAALLAGAAQAAPPGDQGQGGGAIEVPAPAGSDEAAGRVDGTEQPAPVWSSQTDQVSDADAAARAQFEKVSVDEARRRFAVEAAAAGLQQVAADRYRDTYAGLWLVHEPFGVAVSFTDGAEAKVADLSDEFAYPELLRPTDAVVSEQTLLGLQGDIVADRSDVQRGRQSRAPESLRANGGRYDVAVEHMANRVVITLPAPNEKARAEVRQRYGAAVALEAGEGGPAACGIYDCRYAMMSGLELTQPSVTCSSAFAAYGSGYRYVLSAGHCYTQANESRRWNGGSYYGYTDRYQYSGNVDAERIRRASSAWLESSKYFATGSDPTMVSSFARLADIPINTYVGKTGRTTGTTRGYVTKKYISPSWIPSVGNAYFQIDACIRPGDSGGGVWRAGAAYGIVQGAYYNTQCRRSDGAVVTYSDGGQGVINAIDYAISAMGVNLLYNTNLAPRASASRSCSLLSCTFYGSSSSDQDGRVTSWSWNFGDGTTGSGSTVSKSYLLPGTYTVRLTVSDNNGATNTTSMSVSVP